MLNNPRVRGELARLDEAQAERVQAGLLRNPLVSLTALRPEGGGRFELDYSLMLSLFDLFTRSRRTAVADAAQRRVEAEVIGQLIAIAQDTQAAYYDALIAEESSAFGANNRPSTATSCDCCNAKPARVPCRPRRFCSNRRSPPCRPMKCRWRKRV